MLAPASSHNADDLKHRRFQNAALLLLSAAAVSHAALTLPPQRAKKLTDFVPSLCLPDRDRQQMADAQHQVLISRVEDVADKRQFALRNIQ